MTFDTPTNMQEVYDTLRNLFIHYRVRTPDYEQLNIKNVTLPTLQYVAKTEEELNKLATDALAGEQEREKINLRLELNGLLAVKQAKKDKITAQLQQGVERIEKTYQDAKDKYLEWAGKRGVLSSETVTKALIDYDVKMNGEINAYSLPLNVEIASLEGEIADLTSRLSGVDTLYLGAYESNLQNKINQLSAEQEKIEREVFKYNNGVSEKLQRYENNVKEMKATLELKYLQIQSLPFTKEQLVQIGYYGDCLRCVTSYTNTLAPDVAFELVAQEAELAVYLDDYYETLVYSYRMRLPDAI